jgi:uncharacterized protein (TIGR03435 family)
MLSDQVNSPVTDATGLKGKYDFALSWVMPSRVPLPPPAIDGPTVFAAIQEQMGLKLEPKKGTVDMFVIDHVEKTPTGN